MRSLSRSNNQLRRPPAETDLDIILQHMLDMTGTSRLDDKLSRMHERIEFAYDQIRQRYQDADIVSLLIKRYQVSRSTAYCDIRNARMLFGEMGPVNLSFEIRELLQLSLLNIRMAVDNKNVKELTRAIKARTNILKLHKERDDIDWSKIEPNAYYLMINVAEGAIRLDLDQFDKVPKTEQQSIFSQLMDHFDAEVVEIISEDVNPSGQTTVTEQGTAHDSSASGEH
jgi:hypothetical protein